jgi:N-acetylmuramoyl-L-alanine amidase
MKKIVIAILLGSLLVLSACSTNKNIAVATNNPVKTANQTAEKAAENNAVDKTQGNDAVDKTQENKEIQSDNTSQSTLNENKKIIVIDPGHANKSNLNKEQNSPDSPVMKIKDGGGAQGIVTKTPEYSINMNVAMKLKPLLEQKGFIVIMTKTDNSVSLGNIERAEIGNKANANLVIRIHADSNDNTAAKGASMLVPDKINDNTRAIYDESQRCGKIVLDALASEVGMKNRGIIVSKDMTGFNWSKVPVILVEMGFLSNPEEDKLLSSSSYQDKLSKGLADGISECFD